MQVKSSRVSGSVQEQVTLVHFALSNQEKVFTNFSLFERQELLTLVNYVDFFYHENFVPSAQKGHFIITFTLRQLKDWMKWG